MNLCHVAAFLTVQLTLKKLQAILSKLHFSLIFCRIDADAFRAWTVPIYSTITFRSCRRHFCKPSYSLLPTHFSKMNIFMKNCTLTIFKKQKIASIIWIQKSRQLYPLISFSSPTRDVSSFFEPTANAPFHLELLDPRIVSWTKKISEKF